jgi:hypothetical protein
MSPLNEKDEKTWSMFCHLAALIGFVFPFGNILAPLTVWLIKKDESALVDLNGRRSLNFQISMTIYMIVSAILLILLIGAFLMMAVGLVDLILVIIAAVKVSNREDYKYPLSIKFLNEN